MCEKKVFLDMFVVSFCYSTSFGRVPKTFLRNPTIKGGGVFTPNPQSFWYKKLIQQTRYPPNP